MRVKKRSTTNRHDISEILYQSIFPLRLKLLKDLACTIIKDFQAFNTASGPAPDFELEHGFNFYDEVRRFEIQLIVYALNKSDGQQRQAARLLGLKASTLNAKLKLYNISPRNPVAALPPQTIDLASHHSQARDCSTIQ